MIEVEGLHCGYGNEEVLQGLNLRVEAGEMTGILGPNGSGKTTLMLALTGVIPVLKGKVRIQGEDIAGKGPRWTALRVASVPQKTEVSFPFKCLSVVLMGRYPHLEGWGGHGREDLEAAINAMEVTGTSHLADRSIKGVSGGEAQMVIIARAMAQQAPILLLDEATSNLDVAHKITIFDLLAQNNREGVTIVCVMHDLNLAALYCRRLIFLKNGKVVLDGKTEDVFNDRDLSNIYETEIRVAAHPVWDKPQAHFVPGGNCRADLGGHVSRGCAIHGAPDHG